MKIGSFEIEKTAALAPMAGVGDRAFREICKEHGAAYTIGEMCSAKGLTYGSDRSAELLIMSPLEQPCAIQLFSSDPESMAKAVVLAQKYQPQIIDINMGCPAPKIVNGGSGSALMKDLLMAEQILRAAVKNSSVPVTVKFRKGWDEHSANAVELAQIAEACGVAAVTIHGRTKAQMYGFPIDLEIIRAVKDGVRIPVIGNGGITTGAQAVEMYEKTGCDLVMVGQGALGYPWIFEQINAYLKDGTILPEPTTEERLHVLIAQVTKAVDYKGERMALREARTHVAWYLKGFRGAASLRGRSSQLSTLMELEEFAELVLRTSEE